MVNSFTLINLIKMIRVTNPLHCLQVKKVNCSIKDIGYYLKETFQVTLRP